MAAAKSCASEAIRQAVSQLHRLYNSQVDSKHSCGRRAFIRRWIEAILAPSDLELVRRDVATLGHSRAFDCLRNSLRGHLEQLCIDSLEERLSPDSHQWMPDNTESISCRESVLWEITSTCGSPIISDFLEGLPPLEEALPNHPREVENWKSVSHALSRLRRTTRAGDRAEPPKKEYFRCQHIRALKKSVRQIESGRLPGTSIHRFEMGNMQQRQRWACLQNIFQQYKTQLTTLSSTRSGPTTDGKTKRQGEEGPQEKSFNNTFCRNFFESDAIQAYNLVFCDLVYDVPPDVLCDKMKMWCCAGEHSAACVDVWSDVKLYAQFGMLEELDVPRSEAEVDVDLLA